MGMDDGLVWVSHRAAMYHFVEALLHLVNMLLRPRDGSLVRLANFAASQPLHMVRGLCIALGSRFGGTNVGRKCLRRLSVDVSGLPRPGMHILGL